MTLIEASRRFHISMEKLKYYEKNGLLESSISSDGKKEYTETELRHVGEIYSLLKAGLDIDVLKKYLKMPDNEKSKEERVRILRKQRYKLLDEIHNKQQLLDELDYMIENLKK